LTGVGERPGSDLNFTATPPPRLGAINEEGEELEMSSFLRTGTTKSGLMRTGLDSTQP